MFGDRFFVAAEASDQPGAGRVPIRHRLQRREGLRRNDEQGLRWVEIADSLREVRAIDIGHESEGRVARAVILERLVSHHRSEVGTAYTDVDDVTNALA